ncbi:hypothetical protein GJ496_008717 [Pomphorhynchus laevis]|nr:hypothetical protein GJ496_008717 [Pomphorhynchus laevis]
MPLTYESQKLSCVLMKSEISCMGTTLNRGRIIANKSTTVFLIKALRPRNNQELKPFLGLANYHSKFVPRLSEICSPFYQAIQGSEIWHWTNECEQSFKMAKVILTNPQTLYHLNPNKELVLTCDASNVGVGGALGNLSDSQTV